jgi:hypothetical protein
MRPENQSAAKKPLDRRTRLHDRRHDHDSTDELKRIRGLKVENWLR